MEEIAKVVSLLLLEIPAFAGMTMGAGRYGGDCHGKPEGLPRNGARIRIGVYPVHLWLERGSVNPYYPLNLRQRVGRRRVA
jgi:hypothetical protein